MMLEISARNQLQTRVVVVNKGAVNGDVELALSDGGSLFANVSNAAIDDLDIQPGAELIAVIKSSSVFLAIGDSLKISARNCLRASIASIAEGAVESEIKLQLPSGDCLTAIVTGATVAELGLEQGGQCTALIKASQVILAKAG